MFKDDVLFYMKSQQKLNEGIKFFKDSGKIENLVRKIRVKSYLVKDAKAKEELNKFCGDLLKIAPDFRNLESEYQEAQSKEEKEQIKEKYKSLEVKYQSLLQSMNKEAFYTAIKVANVGLLIAGILGMLLFIFLGSNKTVFYQDPKFLPQLKNSVAVILQKNQNAIVKDTDMILSKI